MEIGYLQYKKPDKFNIKPSELKKNLHLSHYNANPGHQDPSPYQVSVEGKNKFKLTTNKQKVKLIVN